MGFKDPHKQIAYLRYMSIRTRCHNKKNKAYTYYGAKGITLDITWPQFCKWFIKNVPLGSKLTVGRKDHSKNYSIRNITAQTFYAQIAEKNSRNGSRVGAFRVSDNVLVKAFDSQAEADRFYSFKAGAVAKHIAMNWPRSYKCRDLYFRRLDVSQV